ncbi:hypothetical protein AB0C61_12840 [Streptomyces sp. NPDC048680]|uniref:hypothetical protein n=1 Tax=Streptomyces sp. NPDC048680 TaxID=3155492 RepID=UPI003431948A
MVHELRPRNLRPLTRKFLLCASALAVALVTGCTSDSGGQSAPASGPRTQQNPSTTAPRNDDRQGEQVEKTLGTAEVGDNDPLFIEAGLERVGDGFHSVPELARGHAYELSVVCVGQGHIRLSVALKSPLRRTLACDGAMLRQRLTASGETVRIDGDRMAGATGMVGWRLDKVNKTDE